MSTPDSKLIVVLDRSPLFAKTSKVEINFEVKDSKNAKDPATSTTTEEKQDDEGSTSIDKSMWTSALEGLLELHRVVADLFPDNDRLMRVAISGATSKMLENEWKDELIDQEDLLSLLEELVPPQAEDEPASSIGGVSLAIDQLTALTNKQKEQLKKRKAEKKKEAKKKTENERFEEEIKQVKEEETNCGSIVVFTQCADDLEIGNLEKEIGKILEAKNKIASNNKDLSPLGRINVFFLNLYSAEEKCTVTTRGLRQNLSVPVMWTSVVSRDCTQVTEAVHSLLISAYSLVSTTVAKIPMKEENSSSMNYDVELLHRSGVHNILELLGVVEPNSSLSNSKTGVAYSSVRLTWATVPKNFGNMFPRTRIRAICTPADVNSRPSACLTNFVMDGRCVMLDLERKGPAAKYKPNVNNHLISHMLLAHSGRIYIHAIDFRPNKRRPKWLKTNSRLQPLSTPNRVHALRKLLKQAMLKAPKGNVDSVKLPEPWASIPSGSGRRHMERITRHFHLTPAKTFIWQGDIIERHFEPMCKYVTRHHLTQAQMDEISENIQKLVVHRDKGKAFALPTEKITSTLVKEMHSNDEQLRVGLAEFARYLSSYANISEKHMEVFNMYMKTLNLEKVLTISTEDILPPEIDESEIGDVVLMNEDDDEEDDEEEEGELVDEVASDEDGELSDIDNFDPQKLKEELERKRPIIVRPPPSDSPLTETDISGESAIGSRSATPSSTTAPPKKEKMPEKYRWKPDEVVSLLDILCDQIERKTAKRRREFVGREEAQGKIARLYPNLVVNRPGTPNANERGGSGTPRGAGAY